MPAKQQVASPAAADANPSKLFFTQTLPRDIPLSDCILDLADNAVHSLVTGNGLDVSEHLFAGTKAKKLTGSIHITFTGSSFTMKDDCGGISIEDAEKHVFRLGEPADDTANTGLGVYGIGMTRAFFKIGDEISVASHTRDERFEIDIDVPAWLETTDWSFPFTKTLKQKSNTAGTEISISKLHQPVAEQFRSAAFRKILIDKMSRAFALFMKAGLKITVNGHAVVEADVPDLVESKELQSIRHMIKQNGIDVLIMTGLSPKDDKTPRGWYVFCNGRMVLDADKTDKTGWGIDVQPNFHNKYNHFLGYVYFRSRHLSNLPWTTTKDNVDRESDIYQAALREMRVLSRPVLNFLNNVYEDVKEQAVPERTAFEKAKPVSPLQVATRPNTTFLPVEIKRTPADIQVSIQYKRSQKKLDQIKEALGRSRMSASRIGEYTFDWFYDRNCK
jgi:hypothetical protein